MQTGIRARISRALPEESRERIIGGFSGLYAVLARVRAPYDYIFILSHMRAGSSLLALLLGNNAEICGFGENFLTYRSPRDLELLAGRNLFRLQPLRLPGRERYMLDKLVHDDLLDPRRVPMLAANRSRFIFLLREPEATIRSMMRMPVETNDETLSTGLYVMRLAMLEKYAAEMRGSAGAFLLSYEDITRRTESALAALADFLELKRPLSAEYDVLGPMRRPRTAAHEKLQLGRIDRQRRPVPQEFPRTPIAAHNLRVAEAAFERCWKALSAISVTVEETAG